MSEKHSVLIKKDIDNHEWLFKQLQPGEIGLLYYDGMEKDWPIPLIVVSNIDGRLEISIKINEEAKNINEQLDRVMPYVNRACHDLYDFQGPSRKSIPHILIDEHEKGKTYKDISEEINSYLAGLLQFICKENVKPFCITNPKGEINSINLNGWKSEKGATSGAVLRFYKLLHELGFKNGQIEEIMIRGLSNLKKGISIFGKYPPVSKMVMQTKLNNFKKSKAYKAYKKEPPAIQHE